jgi:hypothetical protein
MIARPLLAIHEASLKREDSADITACISARAGMRSD